jgi:septum formation protein
MLRNAGVPFSAHPARIDEAAIRDALVAEGATPRDIADALAEMKARRVAQRFPEALVIGSDQVLDHQGDILGKPADRDAAKAQLRRLRGTRHSLHAAVVLYERGKPVWRQSGEARLTMRTFSDAYLDAYLDRQGPDALTTVGAYRVEAEGIRLFERIEGDHFTILGMPLLPLLAYLTARGFVAG